MSKRARVFVGVVLCLAAACAEEHEQVDLRCLDEAEMVSPSASPADDAPPAPNSSEPPLGGICDGSDELRVVVASNLGPGTLEAFHWRAQSTRPFLIVDGGCHYYAAGYELGPVTQGRLTAKMLAELTEDLALADLPNLPSRRDDCADHWSDRLVATQDHSLRCRCDDCGEGTPSTKAIQNAVAWIDRLTAEGEPLTGTLMAVAHLGEPVENDTGPTQSVFDWPLETAIPKIANLVDPRWRGGTYFSGKDAAALRQLRDKTIATPLLDEPRLLPFLMYVSSCGQTYALNVRDELPASVEAKLNALVEVAWKRPVIPSCVAFGQTLSPCPL